ESALYVKRRFRRLGRGSRILAEQSVPLSGQYATWRAPAARVVNYQSAPRLYVGSVWKGAFHASDWAGWVSLGGGCCARVRGIEGGNSGARHWPRSAVC